MDYSSENSEARSGSSCPHPVHVIPTTKRNQAKKLTLDPAEVVENKQKPPLDEKGDT